MVQVPVNANVECTDGHAGKSTHIIFDPETRTVTYFVVKDDRDRTAQDRLVPVDQVRQVSGDTIYVNCSTEDINQMAPFSAKQFLTYTFEDYSTGASVAPWEPSMPEKRTAYVDNVEESIPTGMRSIQQGAKVQATDGPVGEVGDLLVDPDTREITHFTLREGHLWGEKKITLPLSAIDRAFETEVFLKLSKADIRELPAIPAKTKYEKAGSQGGIELIARVYDQVDKADKALADIRDLQRSQRGSLKIRNAAILVKDADGDVSFHETGDISPAKGGLIGAIGGGLLGALAGPGGIIIGALAGAGAGRVATRWIDLGFADEFLERLQTHLKPNSSALILLVEHQYLNKLNETMASLEGIVLQQTLTDAVVQELLDEA